MAGRSPLLLLTTTTRGRALVLGCLLTASAALIIGPTGAVAAPTLAPTHVAITSIVNTAAGFTLPNTPGAPAALLRAGDTFDLTVVLLDRNKVPAALSNSKDTTITLGPAASFAVESSPRTALIPAKKTTVTFTGLKLAAASADITLTATASGFSAATALRSGAAGPFNLVKTYKQVSISDRSGSLTVSADGVNTRCRIGDGTTYPQTCVELVAPFGVSSDAVFSSGECRSTVDCGTSGDLLQVLADLSGKGYDNTHPATVIVNCDKSLCSNGGVPSFIVQASLDGGGALSAAPACRKKGVIDAGKDYCVDYVQSTRDNAGDLRLYLLIARDARAICC